MEQKNVLDCIRKELIDSKSRIEQELKTGKLSKLSFKEKKPVIYRVSRLGRIIKAIDNLNNILL